MPGEDDWLYHITSKTVARIIKEKGLRSALVRIGRAVAAPTGSFNRDRQEKQLDRTKARLAGYIAELIGRGATEDTIRTKPGVYVPFTFTTTGSNDDFLRLTPLETNALGNYRVAHGGLGAPNNAKARALPTKNRAKVLAAELMGNKVHSLTRLAVQVQTWTYNIEETITASHVYFLVPQYAVTGYNDYTKGMHVDNLVVLRVRKDDVTNLVDDEADFRALRTKDEVTADKFQLITTPSRFIEQEYRRDDGSWSPLADWQG